MEKTEDAGIIKCSRCKETWPRFVYNDKGKIVEGPGDAMSKLAWHFQTKHSLAYAQLGKKRAPGKTQGA